MKSWWGAQRLSKWPAEAADNEGGIKRIGVIGEAADSVREVFLLSLSMILLLFHLLDGQRDSPAVLKLGEPSRGNPRGIEGKTRT